MARGRRRRRVSGPVYVEPQEWPPPLGADDHGKFCRCYECDRIREELYENFELRREGLL